MKAPFTFRSYQREDMARAALMDGVVFSWEQGLGKSLAAFAMPMIWKADLTLIVAPGSLHKQLAAEGRDKFGVDCVVLNTVADAMADDALRARILEPDTPSAEFSGPRFYLTTYQALGMNGADERAAEIRTIKKVETLFVPENAQRLRLDTAPDCDPTGDDWDGVGETREGITCLHRPSLSTVVARAFDCVACDEATRMKGDGTYLSQGVRRLQPAKRLILTGTPIKNRLTDLFWLAHWAAGGHADATARWPYGDSTSDKQHFASEHLVSERNNTKEDQSAADGGRRRTYTKQTNEICGLHRLWKLLAPIVLRRRKSDVGEDLVAKRVIPMRVPMGTSQAVAYGHYLSHPPKETKDGEPMARLASCAAQLGNLRIASLCPEADNLDPFKGWEYHDAFTRTGRENIDKPTPWHPKNAATLQLVRECLDRGEQVVLFSPFRAWSQWAQRTLTAAGITCDRLDGDLSPAKRGERAAAFKRKDYAVLIAGLKSMGEGHSFDQCPNLILPSLDWAYDVNAQAIERVHRLTSKVDVRIYTLIAEGTIDERLASLFNEKSDAADLALDGQLFKPETEEVNLFALLEEAIANFDPEADSTPEADVRSEWESNLRPALQRAHAKWSAETGTRNAESHHLPAATGVSNQPEPSKAKTKTLTGKQSNDSPSPALRVPSSTIPFPTHPGIRMTTKNQEPGTKHHEPETKNQEPDPIPFPTAPGLTTPSLQDSTTPPLQNPPTPSLQDSSPSASAPAPEATDAPANVIAFPGNPSLTIEEKEAEADKDRPKPAPTERLFPAFGGGFVSLH